MSCPASCIVRIIVLFMLITWQWPCHSQADSLEFVGVTGNSGQAGKALVHAGEIQGGGVITDAKGRIYASGGDHINVLNSQGQTLWTIPLPEQGWVVGGQKFVEADGQLYFVAGQPYRRLGGYHLLYNPSALLYPNICRVAMRPGVTSHIVVNTKTIGWSTPSENGRLVLAQHQDSVYVGMSLFTPDKLRVSQLVNDKLVTLFEYPKRGGGLAVDEQGDFWIAAGAVVRKLNINGDPVQTFKPQSMPPLKSVPSSYAGMVMLTRNAMWDAGHYGFLGRFDRNVQPDPGAVSGWVQSLAQVFQITDAHDDQYYILSQDALYLASINKNQLQLHKRFGAIANAKALVLTGNGYIGVGHDSRQGMQWFDFDNNNPAAVPVRSEYGGPICQGYANDTNAWSYALTPTYLTLDHIPQPTTYMLRSFTPEPFINNRNNSEPVRRTSITLAQPPTAVTRVGKFLFAIDHFDQADQSHDAQLLRTVYASNNNLAPIKLLTQPTSIASTGNLLLIAQSGGVHAYHVNSQGELVFQWTLTHVQPNDPLGKTLHVATANGLLLVADTLRHRVVVYAMGDGQQKPASALSMFGKTDQPGNHLDELNHPTLVSIRNAKAVVYDAGNERVMKFRFQ